jgi:hypothetical protein
MRQGFYSSAFHISLCFNTSSYTGTITAYIHGDTVHRLASAENEPGAVTDPARKEKSAKNTDNGSPSTEQCLSRDMSEAIFWRYSLT